MVTKLLTSNFKTWAARLFARSFKPSTTVSQFTPADFLRYVTLGYVNNLYAVELLKTTSTSDIYIPDVSNYYVFAGNSTIKTTTIANNACVDTSVYGSQYNIYDGMLFGKRAGPEDVSLMIARNEWAANKVYSMYDDKNPLLFQEPFFVSVLEGGDYHVFKCIDNNNGALSTVRPSPTLSTNATPPAVLLPTISSDFFYQTSDNYVWMYLYSIPFVTYQKFATSGFIPLTVKYSASPPKAGSIEAMLVENGGANYQYLKGNFEPRPSTVLDPKTLFLNPDTVGLFEIPNIYQDYALYNYNEIRKIVSSGKTASGEKFVIVDSAFSTSGGLFEVFPFVQITDASGQSATARPELVDGVITNIVMINTGFDYSTSNVTVLGKTGYYDTTGLFVYTTTPATVRAIISPPRGHGRDLVNELFADKVCVSVDFVGNTHPLTSYTEYGLMLDPVFKEVTINVASSLGVVPSNVVDLFVGDILVQIPSGAYGTVKSFNTTTGDVVLTNVVGVFQFDVAITSYFTKEVFTATKPSATPLINTLQDTFITSEIVDNSGEILLIRDDVTTTRTITQTERIKLLVDF